MNEFLKEFDARLQDQAPHLPRVDTMIEQQIEPLPYDPEYELSRKRADAVNTVLRAKNIQGEITTADATKIWLIAATLETVSGSI